MLLIDEVEFSIACLVLYIYIEQRPMLRMLQFVVEKDEPHSPHLPPISKSVGPQCIYLMSILISK